MTVHDLIEAVIPCIKKKNYSANYVRGMTQTFHQLEKYCKEYNEIFFNVELGQRFLLDKYGIDPGTVLQKFSRQHRAMDLLSDYMHFGTVMIRRRRNRSFPEGLQNTSEGYLKQMELRGRKKNTVLSHRKFLLRFTDFLDSIGVFRYESLTLEAVNLFIKVVLCNYCNSVAMEYYGMLKRFLQHLEQSEKSTKDLSQKIIKVKRSSTFARIPTTLTMEQIESILSSVDRESPQ